MVDRVQNAFLPLTGYRVLDCGSYMAAPLATQILADLGATVIKIVAPRGDPFIAFGYKRDGIGASWLSVNHGKEIREIDLKVLEGHQTFLDLVAHADAVVHNWRPDVQRRLGLSGASLQEINPTLVVVEVCGFAPTDSEADLPTFDSIIQAHTGLTDISLRSGSRQGLPVNLVDKCTGLYVANMLTSALLARNATGNAPAPLVVPMVDVMCHFNFPDTYQHLVHTDKSRPWIPPANILVDCVDGTIVLSPPNRGELKKVAEALDNIDIVAMLDDSSGFNPTELLAKSSESIRQALAPMKSEEAITFLHEHKISAARVLDAQAFSAWDAGRAHPAIQEVEHASGWTYRKSRYPAYYNEEK